MKIVVSTVLSDPKYEIHVYSGPKSLNCLSNMIDSWLTQRSGSPKLAVCGIFGSMAPDPEVQDILNFES